VKRLRSSPGHARDDDDTDSERHNAQRYRQMDRQTDRQDDSLMPTADHTV